MKNNATGTMTINGVERPYHVNSTRQTQQYTETMNIELDDYWTDIAKMSSGGTLTNERIVVAFLWSALYAGAIKETRKCDFTHDDVIDWFEDADESEGAELLKPLNTLMDILNEKKKELETQVTATPAETATINKLMKAAR